MQHDLQDPYKENLNTIEKELKVSGERITELKSFISDNSNESQY